MWAGTPILGYDVDRSNGGPKLVINPAEASQVCQIFELYLERGSLLPVVAELERRDWGNNAWTTRSGKQRGGLPFDKCRLHNLLINVPYAGKIRHKDQVYAGEHEPIVSDDLFTAVQQLLQRKGRNSNVEHRNRHGALLRGLLYCSACDRAMSHTFTTRGNRRYRYYTCTNATKRGRRACPSGSLPAIEIENAVVDQIRCIGGDTALLADTLTEARQQIQTAVQRLKGERRTVKRGLARQNADLQRSATSDEHAPTSADLTDQIGTAERRMTEIDARVAGLEAERIDAADVAAAFADFEYVWKALSPREQARVLHLLVRRVEFNVAESTIEVSFHPMGIKALADESLVETEEAA